MARNRYDIDEVMEDHFDLGQLKRLGHYVLPFKKDMFLAAFLMLSASALTMLIPRFFMTVMNDIIPAGDIRGLFLISFYTLLIILYSVVSLKAKIKITNREANPSSTSCGPIFSAICRSFLSPTMMTNPMEKSR